MTISLLTRLGVVLLLVNCYTCYFRHLVQEVKSTKRYKQLEGSNFSSK